MVDTHAYIEHFSMSLAELKKKFIDSTKLVLKEKLSNNIDTLNRQKSLIIIAYNNIITYIEENSGVDKKNDEIYDQEFKYVQIKLQQCLEKLHSNYVLSKEVILVNVDEVHINEMNNTEFLKIASGHLNRNYAGDPLALTNFLDSIRLLQTLATTDELQQFLASFIRTRIEGRAREALKDSDTTVTAIIEALKTNIKADNSKVVEGKILSLKLNAENAPTFAERADELAEALRRSLINEGVSANKANTMAIDKTIELCRNNTRSDLVKSVLEASTYAVPKDVVAKFVTQIDKSRQEHQVLAYRKTSNQKPTTFNKNNSSHTNRRYSQYNNSHQNHNRGQYSGSQQNRRGNHSRNSSHNSHYRGNNRNHNNRSNIRVTQAENSRAPQEALGEEI